MSAVLGQTAASGPRARRRLGRSGRIGLSALALLALAACSMVETIPIGVHKAEDGLACRSNAGAYHLPKSLLRVEVYADDNTNPVLALSRQIVADQRFNFCLDYLASTTADDTIDIRKVKDHNLLTLVSSDAVDQSRYILQTLIRSVFIVASGNPQFQAYGDPDRSYQAKAGDKFRVKLLHVEYDPFDPERSAMINEALRDHGFCLVLGAYTVYATRAQIDQYCDSPRAALKRLGAFRPEYQKARIPEDVADRAESERRQMLRRAVLEGSGVYYRPRIPYRLELYAKANPKAPGGWRLRLFRQVPMENISPLVLAGVDRTIFAKRKTTLLFAGGMLERTCVYKGSELLQASYIPLQIVQSVVALPTEILQVRIDQTSHERDLAQVNQELIKTQLRFLEVQKSGKSDRPAGKTNLGESGFKKQTLAEIDAENYDYVKNKVRAGPTGDLDAEYKTVCPTSGDKYVGAVAVPKGSLFPGPPD
jgi:hypothetical protein